MMTTNQKYAEDVLYAVITNTDRTEGRGYEYIKHLCYKEVTAQRLGKGNYIQGVDCPIIKIPIIKLMGGDIVVNIDYLGVDSPSCEDLDKIKRDEQAQSRANRRAILLDRLDQLGFTEEQITLLQGQ
jgi:hypothetical protein